MNTRNASYPWDQFDPDWYARHNYGQQRRDDAELFHRTRTHFAAAGLRPDASGLDVGAGANLFPLLALLPHCAEVTLRDRSTANVAWLRAACDDLPPMWSPYAGPDWAGTVEQVRKKALVEQGSVFDLPEAGWDAGTMFFVAESITGLRVEFEDAVASFLTALKPSAPFAAAFMAGSTGYRVADQWFPAVPVHAGDVSGFLARLGATADVTTVVDGTPLRDGYDGMILATGWAR